MKWTVNIMVKWVNWTLVDINTDPVFFHGRTGDAWQSYVCETVPFDADDQVTAGVDMCFCPEDKISMDIT